MKTKQINLKETGPNFCLDTLYSDERYEKPFVIETKYGELYTVRLCWFQGHGNNYRFVNGDEYDENAVYISPSSVAYIEVR